MLKKFLKNKKLPLKDLGESPNEMHDYVIKKHNLKHGLQTINFLELFPNFEDTVFPATFLPGGSWPTDYALLRGLAGKFENCRYLEIGTWRGESIANVASVAKECVSVSFSDDELRERGRPEEVIETSRFFSKNLSNVTHIGHDSQTLDFSRLGKFDLIFVDGDHSFQNILNDTKKVFPLLKDDNSMIVWHDYLGNEGTVRWITLAGILDGCPTKNQDKLFHVSSTKCAIFTKKQFKVEYTDFAQIPKNVFTVKLSARPI